MQLYDVAARRSLCDSNTRIVAIGGGTGLSTLLRGLKHFTSNITAVVTVADDGGGSGFLRQDLGMLPPGDIRNCILALAQTEPIMEKLLSYRFSEGSLAGQSFGNLFLAAMDGISANFEEAVKRVSDVLRVTGRVLPVTLTDIRLEALLKDGTVITGESNISVGEKLGNKRIDSIRLLPPHAEAIPEVIEAILDADLITLGPGSLYTSIVPNLLVNGVAQALERTAAPIYYICNIMTQPGETDGMTAFDHADAICRHAGGRMIDYCVMNTEPIPPHLLDKYRQDGAYVTKIEPDRFSRAGIQPITGNFLYVAGDYIRHDYEALARRVMECHRRIGQR